MKKRLEVVRAEKCAWRARYVYVNGNQVAHIGVDPHDGNKPQVFGGIGPWNFRIRLPTLPWRINAGPLYVRAYQLVRKFWFGVDGRYGWGKLEGQNK